MPIQNTHSARWNPKPFAIPCVRIFGLGPLFIPTKNLKPTFKMLIDIMVLEYLGLAHAMSRWKEGFAAMESN